MTRQEFYEKYGNIKVKFSSYCQYTFIYAALLPDGRRLTCGYGGNADEIYHHEVDVDSEVTVNILHPHTGTVYQDGNEVEGFYDY